MSIFTFRVTKTLEQIPGAPGETVVIRKLAPRHLDAAAKASQMEAIAHTKEIGVSFIKELRSLTDEDIKKATQADPLLTYDVPTLIEKAVMSWSFGEGLTRESIEEIDVDAREYLGREILRLSNPKLFKSFDEQQAEQKNG